MGIPDELVCLVSLDEDCISTARGGETYTIEVPKQAVAEEHLAESTEIALLNRDGDEVRSDGGGVSSDSAAGGEDDSGGTPIEEGEILEVEIESVGQEGDGVAKVRGGYVVFVPGTSVGDTVRVKITDVAENHARAEYVSARSA